MTILAIISLKGWSRGFSFLRQPESRAGGHGLPTDSLSDISQIETPAFRVYEHQAGHTGIRLHHPALRKTDANSLHVQQFIKPEIHTDYT